VEEIKGKQISIDKRGTIIQRLFFQIQHSAIAALRSNIIGRKTLSQFKVGYWFAGRYAI
jgi:hypothetical protein